MTIIPFPEEGKKPIPTREEIDIAFHIVGLLTFYEIIPFNLYSSEDISKQHVAIHLITGLLAKMRYED